MMTEQIARLGLCIEAGPDADADELAELAGRLRERLLELDIESAEPATAGPAPTGTRAGEILVAGALTVVLASTLLKELIKTVQLWVSTDRRRKVTLKIGDDVLEFDGITRKNEDKLIQAVINRHTDR